MRREGPIIKRRSPLELIGILPATRPYPGTDAIRREVRERLVSATGLKETQPTWLPPE